MLFKIVIDGDIQFAQAKNQLHLLQSYEKEFGGLMGITSVREVSLDEAACIKVSNTDYDKDNPDDQPEITLASLQNGDDFEILAGEGFE